MVAKAQIVPNHKMVGVRLPHLVQKDLRSPSHERSQLHAMGRS